MSTITDKPPPLPDEPLWWHDSAGERRLLRWGLVACQVATIFITWPVWEARDNSAAIPCLPVIEAGWVDAIQISWFLPALLSAIAIAIFPLPGLIAHTAVLLLAMAFDQVRMQPEFVSIAILLWGTLSWESTRLLARLHLAALWFYAGAHKVMSAGYIEDSGPQGWGLLFARLVGEDGPALPGHFATVLAVGIAFYECSLGILALIPASRRVGAVMAAALHFGILYNLLATWWNAAVWPWNLALAIAAVGYLWDWEECPLTDAWRQNWAVIVAGVAILVTPAFFYVDLCDGYLAHCLYSSNVPSANLALAPFPETFGSEEEKSKKVPPEKLSWIGRLFGAIHADFVPEDSRTVQHVGMRCYLSLHVPFPPVHRLYDQLFRRIAQPGDRMYIDDPRWYAAWRKYATRSLPAEE